LLNILLVDDHAVVRQGIKHILAEAYDQANFGETGSAADLRQFIEAENWDVVVLDLALPDGNGLETLKQLRLMRPKLPVLILSMFPEDQYALRAIKAGAAGYLNKESAPEELVRAIQKILQGGEYISDSLAEELVHYARGDEISPLHKALSDREYQVLCLIASGKEIREIAAELSLSPKTVSTYRARLLEKMSMMTNAELTNYAFRNGLIFQSPDDIKSP